MEELILCESAELLRSVDPDDGYRALDLEDHLIDWLGRLVHRDGKSKSGKGIKDFYQKCMTCLSYVVASIFYDDIIKPRARFACLVRRERSSGEVAEVKKSTSRV